ncbi:unnamed protein product [Prorocentrum cordatum]|uniref:XPG N-terminal domain-containing protein n=1 Tax=Prorocentrum cordatum TaxID=2364126 RepID=A0ABN9T6G6_9DINO|nr:unnamed protein product [Polarella glacialis]
MRVRHLQSHLTDQQLIRQGKIDALRRVKMGVDTVFWLRSIQALKDPFADALGGIPPGIFGFVDKELDWFKRFDINPLFVFQGVAPGPQHSMFVSRMDQQMELAWTYLGKGQKSEAQKCFAVSTSRINGDFVYFIFHHLRFRGYDCLQAPYFAGAQLAHFVEQGGARAASGDGAGVVHLLLPAARGALVASHAAAGLCAGESREALRLARAAERRLREHGVLAEAAELAGAGGAAAADIDDEWSDGRAGEEPAMWMEVDADSECVDVRDVGDLSVLQGRLAHQAHGCRLPGCRPGAAIAAPTMELDVRERARRALAHLPGHGGSSPSWPRST